MHWGFWVLLLLSIFTSLMIWSWLVELREETNEQDPNYE